CNDLIYNDCNIFNHTNLLEDHSFRLLSASMDSKNPPLNGSLEPPDTKVISNTVEGYNEEGALPRALKGAACQGPASCRQSEIVKRYRVLKKEFLSRQRAKAANFLASNKAALEAYVSHRLQNAGTRGSLPIKKLGTSQTDTPGGWQGASAGGAGTATAVPPPPPNVMQLQLSDRRVTVKPSASTQPVRSYVHILPAVQPPPLYTTWSYLKRNELARDHGRRMFLVDSVGETVPADDGETEERMPWEGIDGAAIDYAMTQLAREYGWQDPDLMEALIDTLRPKPEPEAIAQRLAYLQRLKLADEDRAKAEVEEVLDAFVGSFCRRCRIYGCRTHGGGHVKPHYRPAPPPPDVRGLPCGPGCWRSKVGSTAATAAGAGPLPGLEVGGPAVPVPAYSFPGAGAVLPPGVAAQGQDGMPVEATNLAVSAKALTRPADVMILAGRKDGGDASMGGDDMEVDEEAGGTGEGQQPTAQDSSERTQDAGDPAWPRGAAPVDPRDQDQDSDRSTGCADDDSSGPAWTPYDLSVVRHGIQVFGMGNPCMVALLLDSHTCAEVKRVMDRIAWEQRAARSKQMSAAAATLAPVADTAVPAAAGASMATSGQMGSSALVASNGDGGDDGDGGVGGGEGVGAAEDGSFLNGLARVPARRKGSRAKKMVLSNNKSARSLVVSARAQHGSNDWHEYQPCTCMGNCKADCPCVRAHNFCEKFCACSTTCRERFRGCTCKSGCKTNMCPCWAAGRECDPDLCSGCAPTLELHAEVGRECHNMRLRMRQHAHVVLGTSDIPGAGWGLFAAQYVSKNGFLGEYTGDLITQDEANRRGSIYDFMNNSYLFNLNNEWVVDAKFRGNKLRCANHSEEPVAKAKVLLVDGESRIAILADKNLSPGMEITYDYRYSDDTAPHWVKKKQRG
ncbi:hypothetical protein Vretimale_15003, partial [Volvox reticuliferus]